MVTLKEVTEFIEGSQKICKLIGFGRGVAKAEAIQKKIRRLGENIKESYVQGKMDSLRRDV